MHRFFALALLLAPCALLPAAQPNILLIVADDLGYADVSFNGCKDYETPHLDALAKSGVICTSGYVSHPFCSPTRAGLLTGRHQQRFGHENNPKWDPADTVAGLPLTETTLPQVLKSAGYATGWVGKWHLGAHPQFHPLKRGFDESYGVLGGGHMYLPRSKGGAEYTIPLDRNGAAEEQTKYLTDHFGDEASAFITRHKGKPWFLYLAFNAPHTPLQASDAWLERVKHIPDERRRTLAAMSVAMDDAVGRAMQAARETGAAENTLVFFFSDNGGPIAVAPCDNGPLRDGKGSVFEGGIRVPFVVSWPAKLKAGSRFEHPVTSLDVFATACAVADAKVPEGVKLDGVNVIPHLSGENSAAPHERLYWRTGGGDSFALRQGDWKWVKPRGADKAMLFNLKDDVGEKTDLTAQKPEVAAELEKAVMAWNKELITPLFQSPRPAGKRTQPAQVKSSN